MPLFYRWSVIIFSLFPFNMIMSCNSMLIMIFGVFFKTLLFPFLFLKRAGYPFQSDYFFSRFFLKNDYFRSVSFYI